MNGKVTVAELVQHGLSNHPASVIGVAFPAIDAVLCRSHVNGTALQRLGVADEHTPAAAVLLIGGTGIEHALCVWCASCQATTGGTR